MQTQRRKKSLTDAQNMNVANMAMTKKNDVARESSNAPNAEQHDLEGLENSDDDNNDDDDDEDDLDEPAQMVGAGESDDEYGGIPSASDDDSASEDEDDEGNVLRAAEVDLIDEFERTEERRIASAVATDFDNMFLEEGDDWNPLSTADTRANGFDMNNDPFVGLASNDVLYQEMWNDAEDALASWRLPSVAGRRTNSEDSVTTKKRVRFEETEAHIEVHSRTSSMSGSEDPNEVFPDLFTSQDDPSLRQCFGLDIDPDATFDHDYSDAGSCFDFDGDAERLAYAIDEESDTDSATSSVSSADEEGDTTDEETEEESMARMREMQRARGILRSPRLAPTTPTQARRLSSSRQQTTPRLVTPKSGRTPQPGTFKLDPTRAAMSVDTTGKKFKLIPPAKPLEKDQAFWRRARSAASSRQTSPVSSPGLSFRSPNAPQAPTRPFTAQSTLGSMFDGNLDFLQNNAEHDTNAEFFGAVSGSVLASRPQTSFGSVTLTEDSDAELEDINMQDFIDMDGYDSDSDELQAHVITSPSRSRPYDGMGAHAAEYGLLDHLDQQRGLVGSFRLNQNQVKHVSSLASHPAKRALTAESNALQKGRRAAANTPMTPARKKRGSQDFGLTGSGIRKAVSSPLANRRPRSRGASLSGIGVQQTLSPSIMN